MGDGGSTMKPTRNILKALWIGSLLLVGGTTSAAGQGSSRQVLTLQVVELNKLYLPSLWIQPFQHSDSIAPHQFHLDWICNGEEKKITVAKKTPGGSLLLRANVLSASGDVVESSVEIRVSNSPVDLLIGLSRSAGRCIIQYRFQEKEAATADFADAILYTITGS